MRHLISGNKLGRNSTLRKATVRDIAKATLIRERICTTKAKAKEAQKMVDRLITLGKKGTLAHRRKAFAILCDHKLVSELFTRIAHRFRDRNGGYTRIIPLAHRRGDNAQLVYLEITEKEKIIISKSKVAATSKAKDLDAVKDKSSKVSTESKTEQKDTAKKTEHKKTTTTQQTLGKEPKQKGKKIVGGLKNMFRRKKTD